MRGPGVKKPQCHYSGQTKSRTAMLVITQTLLVSGLCEVLLLSGHALHTLAFSGVLLQLIHLLIPPL